MSPDLKIFSKLSSRSSKNNKLTLKTWKGKALKQKGKPQDNFDFSLSNFKNQTTSSYKFFENSHNHISSKSNLVKKFHIKRTFSFVFLKLFKELTKNEQLSIDSLIL